MARRHLIAVPSEAELLRAGIEQMLTLHTAKQMLRGAMLWNPLTDWVIHADVATAADCEEVATAQRRAVSVSPVLPAANVSNTVGVMVCVEHLDALETVAFHWRHGWCCTCLTWAVLTDGQGWSEASAGTDDDDVCLHIALVSMLARSSTPPVPLAEMDPDTLARITVHAEAHGW